MEVGTVVSAQWLLLVSAATPAYRRIKPAFEICSTPILLSKDCVCDFTAKCEVCG